jgi:tripartite-type tricarboxylate transporter receptor subunit TctC
MGETHRNKRWHMTTGCDGFHPSYVLLIVVTLLFTANPSFAQYPDKPIRMVLPFPPGGGTDGLARVLAPKMSQAMGQPIVIDNRPGAGGVAAAELVAKSAPDGYTLFMGSSTLVTATPSLLKLPYDMQKDFAPITMFATAAFILAVNPQVAANSVSQLVALAKAKPGGLPMPPEA